MLQYSIRLITIILQLIASVRIYLVTRVHLASLTIKMTYSEV